MAWGLALRVARREAWRNKGRSLLVATMIALPVTGASAADTLWRSSQVTSAEQAVRDMGRYDAVITPVTVGTAIVQTPDGQQTSPADGSARGNAPGIKGAVPDPQATAAGPGQPGSASTGSPQPAPTALPTSAPTSKSSPTSTSTSASSDLLTLLPPGSRLAPLGGQIEYATWAVKGRSRIWTSLSESDLADPLHDGMTVHRGGTAPTSDGEAAVTTTLLADLGKHVGDSVEVRIDPVVANGTTTPAVAKTFVITGVYDDPTYLQSRILFARPGVFSAAGLTVNHGTASLALVPGGVSWDQVKQLNAHGYVVESKTVMGNPPADSAVPYYSVNPRFHAGLSQGRAVALAVAAIAVSMVLLEIILLAGPAFAVSARRRRRDFGLLGAAGADGRRLRRIVLADGVVLGIAGGVLGVVVGIAAGAAAMPWLGDLSHSEPGGFRVMPLELVGAAVVGVLTGVIAALAPAITTGRQDVLTALTGRRGETRTPWKMPVAGVVGVIAGSLLIAYGALGSSINTLPIVAGIGVAELGVVACTPILVMWSGRLGRFLPLSGRMALRDGARNRGRTAPAVAAIMAAVAGASAVAMYISTQDAKGRAQYVSSLRDGQVSVSLRGVSATDVQQVVSKVGASLPLKDSAVMSGTDFSQDPNAVEPVIARPPANICPPMNNQGFVTEAQLAAAYKLHDSDPRCAHHLQIFDDHLGAAEVTSAGPELLTAMTGADDPAVDAVLAKGGAAVFNPMDLTTAGPNPTVTIAVVPMRCPPPG